jgi:hypothetical protein
MQLVIVFFYFLSIYSLHIYVLEYIKNIYKISHNTALLELTAYIGYASKFTLTRQHVSAFSLGHLQVHQYIRR